MKRIETDMQHEAALPSHYDPIGLSTSDAVAGASGILPASRNTDLPFAAIMAENRELSAEVARLRADRERMCELQRRVMDLLGSKSPERIIHDLRNVLNERELFRSLADI